jgi:hypothetical protein
MRIIYVAENGITDFFFNTVDSSGVLTTLEPEDSGSVELWAVNRENTIDISSALTIGDGSGDTVNGVNTVLLDTDTLNIPVGSYDLILQNAKAAEISVSHSIIGRLEVGGAPANVVSVNGIAVEESSDSVGKIDAIHQRIVGTTEIDFDTDPSTMIITYDGSTSFVYEIFTGADGDEKVTGPDDVITKMVLVTEPS